MNLLSLQNPETELYTRCMHWYTDENMEILRNAEIQGLSRISGFGKLKMGGI